MTQKTSLLIQAHSPETMKEGVQPGILRVQVFKQPRIKTVIRTVVFVPWGDTHVKGVNTASIRGWYYDLMT